MISRGNRVSVKITDFPIDKTEYKFRDQVGTAMAGFPYIITACVSTAMDE